MLRPKGGRTRWASPGTELGIIIAALQSQASAVDDMDDEEEKEPAFCCGLDAWGNTTPKRRPIRPLR
jgi:hypothetical protein